MASSAQTKQRKDTRYLAGAFAAMTILYALDYAESHALRHALAGLGFAFLAYGTLTNGWVTESRNLRGRYSSLVGGVFLLATAVVTSAPAISALVAAIG